MCMLLLSGETRNYINIRKERSRLRDRSSEIEYESKEDYEIGKRETYMTVENVNALVQQFGEEVMVE